MNKQQLLMIFGGVLLITGCVKRIERINVFEDGSADFETQFEGGPSDVLNGDAAPSVDSGWQVQDRTEYDSEGKAKLIRVATKHVGPAEQLPSSYATADSRLQEIGLQFPTMLRIERADGGTYYHFRRVYTRRPFNFVHYFDAQAEKSEAYEDIKGKQAEELTDQDYEALIHVMIEADRAKTSAFIAQTQTELGDQIPQLPLLQAQNAVLKLYDQPDFVDKTLELLHAESDDEFNEFESTFRQRQSDKIAESLTISGIDADTVQVFVEEYQTLRETYEITEDLGDEEWVVTISLPGQLVAHNSPDPFLNKQFMDKREHKGAIADDVKITYRSSSGETGTYYSGPFNVAWKFTGDALHDRDVILMATSFLPDDDADNDE